MIASYIRDSRKHRNHLGAVIVAALAMAATSRDVAACTPAPGTQYDVFTTETVAVLAVVQAVDRWADKDRICWRASYEVEKVLRGSISEPLVLTQCALASAEEIKDFLRSTDEGNSADDDAYGLQAGARVAVAVTSLPPPESMREQIQVEGTFRYIVPSCWGPLHVNLDRLSENERKDILESMTNAPMGR